jgi:chromate transporter
MAGPPSGAERASLDRRPVAFGEALRFWIKLGFINFGGPAGQIALMHRELVDRRGWIPEGQFLRALNFCMILPGPEATQLAAYIGWRLHGILGGLAAGVFFVLPSILVLLVLSWLAAAYAELPAVAGLLYGVQPVVLAIVVEAVIRVGRRTLRHPLLVLFAVAAFVALRFFHVPFPIVVAAAALGGALLERRWPAVFQPRGDGAASADAGDASASPTAHPPAGRAARVVGVFFVLWALPVGAVWLWRGAADVLVQEALFFTQAAFVTFGGAYAVLAYVADVAVNRYGWLDAEQMVQGLALAESTPGPLIMVLQYVGFLGAWRLHGDLDPLLAGTLGALLTTYVTFLPSFLFIFLGAPYIERLAGNRRLQAAFVGVTAAIVGVIANLAVFFGGKVLFPSGGVLDGYALAAATLSFALLQRTRLPVYALIPIGAAVGMLWRLAR